MQDTTKRIIVEQICKAKMEDVWLTLSKIMSDVINDPFKLNDYPNLSYYLYKSQFDIDDFRIDNISFDHIKKHDEDMQKLQGELGIVFKECSTIYNSPEKFFFEVLEKSENIEDFLCIHKEATTEAVGDEISFKVNCDNITPIAAVCGGISYDYTPENC